MACVLLVVLQCGLPGAPALASEAEVRFERLGIDDGLSQASARAVLRDRRGFLWIGTQEGLNRYDGYTIKAYQHDPLDPDSLSDNNVVSLHEDRAGVLWIGTLNGGLNRYDPADGRFRRYLPIAGEPDSLSDPWVRSITSDRAGRLWLGTARGLDRMQGGRFIHYRNRADDPHSLAHDSVRALYVDGDERLWVGTDSGGLNRLDPDSEKFVRYRHADADAAKLRHDFVWAIADAGDGQLWIGNEGGGLDRLDPASGRFSALHPRDDAGAPLGYAPIMGLQTDTRGSVWIATRGAGVGVYEPDADRLRWLRNEPANSHSLSHNTVWTVHQDSAGLIWVGTADSLNRFDPRTRQFAHYRRRDGEPGSLSHDWVRSFLEDARGNLWVGTQEGLNRWDAATARFIHYRRNDTAPANRQSDHFRALAEDPRGGLWVGTDAGLDHLDPASGTFVAIDLQTADHPLAVPDRVATLFVDNDRSLWIGTHETGLIHYDAATAAVTRFRHQPEDPASLSHNQVRIVHRDRSGQLWLGTWGGGLCRMHADRRGFQCYRHSAQRYDSLSNDVVRAIHEDANGIFWLATQGGGLDRFDPATGRSRAFTSRDGLADDSVYGVLEDSRGQLWLSTNNGLSRFDPASGRFTNYTARDGLQSSEFNTGAYYRSRSGELFFGGIGGFNRFFPERIEDDLRPPPVVLTEFLLSNRTVGLATTGEGFSLPQPIEVLRELALSHREVQFSIEFAALDFSDPRRNRYAYILEGFDAGWIETDYRNRRATYTNLPPGDYRLRVRASNPRGAWNQQGASLDIHVRPPPWLSWWAQLVYAVAAFAAGIAALRLRDVRIRRQAMELQRLVDQRTAQLRHSHTELERASLTDPLTGLGNRRYLIAGLQQDVVSLTQSYSTGARHALMLLDVDNFKSINDEHGHAAGDAVLVELAARIKGQCRKGDLAARWGGEEFLLRVAVDDESDALSCAERLRRVMADAPVLFGDARPLAFTCSIGVACLPFAPAEPERLDWEKVLAIADAALYMAKHQGRNQVVCLAANGALGDDFERRLAAAPQELLAAGSLRALSVPR